MDPQDIVWRGVESAERYYRELAFYQTFAGRPWCPTVTARDEQGLRYGLPGHPTLAEALRAGGPPTSRSQIAGSLGLALLELHTAGVTHGNLSAETILVEVSSGQPLLTAPLALASPPGRRFAEAFDLRGCGPLLLRQECPPAVPSRCYERDLAKILDVSTEGLVQRVAACLREELAELGGEERQARKDIPYGSLHLPGLLECEGRRSPSVRLEAFGVDFRGQSVLDVGTHTGSLLFECLERRAELAVGVEFNRERVSWVNRAASFMGLADRVWCWWSDVTTLSLPPEWIERFSILSFQAVFGWLGAKGPDALQRCLKLLRPGGTLLFETNHCQGKSAEEWAQRLVASADGLIENPLFVRKEWERYAYIAVKRRSG
jgi:SAM-dependent methyltransferase